MNAAKSIMWATAWLTSETMPDGLTTALSNKLAVFSLPTNLSTILWYLVMQSNVGLGDGVIVVERGDGSEGSGVLVCSTLGFGLVVDEGDGSVGSSVLVGAIL